MEFGEKVLNLDAQLLINYQPCTPINKYKMKSKGFGDTVAKFTKATGIKYVVDKVAEATNSDCGCDERRDTLNRVFPYKR